MGSKKEKTVIQNVVPPKTPEEIKLLNLNIEQAALQVENLKAQSAFQTEFFDRLEAQLPSLEELRNIAETGGELEIQRLGLQLQEILDLGQDVIAGRDITQGRVDALGELTAQAEAQVQFSPQEQQALNDQIKQVIGAELDLQQQEVQQAGELGQITPGLIQAQLDSIDALISDLANRPEFDQAALEEINNQRLEVVSSQLEATQQQLEGSIERGQESGELFQSQLDVISRLEGQVATFSPAQQQAFNQIQKGIKNQLAQLQQQEITQQLERAGQEDEFLAEALKAVKSGGQLSPQQEKLISSAVDNAKSASFAQIDLDRDVTLDELRDAEASELGGLDASIAAAISGINEDVFQRLNSLDESTQRGLRSIETLSDDALQQVREVLAPARGFRPSDSPITDVGLQIAKERTRAGGEVISSAQRTASGLTSTAGRQIGDITARGEEARSQIAGRFESARTQAQSRADQLRGITGGQIEAQGAQQRLNFPLQAQAQTAQLGFEGVRTIGAEQALAQQLGLEGRDRDTEIQQIIADIATRTQGQSEQAQLSAIEIGLRERGFSLDEALGLAGTSAEIAATVGEGIEQTQQFQQELADTQETRRLNFPLVSGSVRNTLAGDIKEFESEGERFQANLQQNAELNRVNLTNVIGGLGLGIAGIGPNSAGILSNLTQERIAGTTTTTKKTIKDPIGDIAAIAGALG